MSDQSRTLLCARAAFPASVDDVRSRDRTQTVITTARIREEA